MMQNPQLVPKRVLLIDNYDSFTFILKDYLCALGWECETVRNQIAPEKIQKENYQALVISPGPNAPHQAGNLMKILERLAEQIPILGVCLGHQALGLLYGWKCKQAIRPMHGKVSEIRVLQREPLFQNMEKSLQVMRYHSLIIEKPDTQTALKEVAITQQGENMAVVHSVYPLAGVQFHPESILTPQGKQMLKNWLDALPLI